MIKTSITRSCKQISTMVRKGQFSFDNVVQRGFVWNKSQKSNLIHSLVEDYPVPSVYARRVNKIYDVLDGKQRISTIAAYMNDEFALSKIPPVTYESDAIEEPVKETINESTESTSDETQEAASEFETIVEAPVTTEVETTSEIITIDITGKKYSQLPTELQEKIASYSIEINCFEDITDEQIKILFRKLNNGKPLSSKDKNIANCPDITKVSEIGDHDLFDAILSNRGLANRKQIPMVMKIWCMLYTENVSFESRRFNNVISSIVITPEQENEIKAILDKSLDVYNSLETKELRKKFATETHFISFVPFVKKTIDSNIDTKSLTEFFIHFFGSETDASISSVYNDVSKSGAAKATSIAARNQELENAWTEFMTPENN